MRAKLFVVAVVLSVVGSAPAHTNRATKSSKVLALEAVSENVQFAKAAIETLRSQGVEGLDAFLRAHDAELKRRQAEVAGPVRRPADRAWQRISAALDGVCQQRDCYASRLYWYTDFDKAKAAARSSGKPILSLRLLGRLDEELSCANSRFFRIVLYANKEVSELLRNRFILHWESVRPVPRVTIDFGDGRKLERTLTGNSIHYVLDSEGRLIDALPGLYGPRAFLRSLERAETAMTDLRGASSDQERQNIVRQFHRHRLQELSVEWVSDLANVGISSPPSREVEDQQRDRRPPRAEVAGRVAVAKAATERRLLRGISTGQPVIDPVAEQAKWGSIAALHIQDVRLDENSKLLIRVKNLAVYGSSDPASLASFDRLISELQGAIALDTVRNEYILHTKIHEWFASGLAGVDLQAFNERVYDELFLTPQSDPWLGLSPRDGYAGIENDGIRK